MSASPHIKKHVTSSSPPAAVGKESLEDWKLWRPIRPSRTRVADRWASLDGKSGLVAREDNKLAGIVGRAERTRGPQFYLCPYWTGYTGLAHTPFLFFLDTFRLECLIHNLECKQNATTLVLLYNGSFLNKPESILNERF